MADVSCISLDIRTICIFIRYSVCLYFFNVDYFGEKKKERKKKKGIQCSFMSLISISWTLLKCPAFWDK